MIKTFEDLAKGSFSKLAYDFESVGYVVTLFSNVLILVIIEAIVVYPIRRRLTFTFSLLYIEPIYDVVVQDLRFLVFKKVLRKVQNSLSRIHREF